MTQAALPEALDRYAERHPAEADVVARFRALLAAREDCFERRCTEPGHITGSAWILSPQEDAVLLTHHRKLDLWVQLGGHADGDADTHRVALREGVEESGIEGLVSYDAATPFDLDIHVIPARRDEPAHEHFDVRYAFRAAHRSFTVTEESHDLAWVPLDDLASVTDDESVLRMARKWRDRGR